MIALVFAVASAAAWGAGDFCGGLAARRLPVLALALRAHLGGLAILLVVQFVFVQGPAGDVRVVVWERSPASPAAPVWACSTVRSRSAR